MTLSVLVVDDEYSVRDTLTDFLSTLGHTARTVESADEARHAVNSQMPDVVLVDLRLPDSSGLALLESLLAYGPQLGVVMLTGRSDVPAAMLSMRNGAMDFLEKPIRLETLALTSFNCFFLERLNLQDTIVSLELLSLTLVRLRM